MNYLSVDNLTKTYGERILFQGISFGLDKGEKVALIANNGAGKTNLLKIIAGKDTADSGEVALRNSITIGYLEQEPLFDNSLNINQLIAKSNTQVHEAIRAYEMALDNQDVLAEATAKMDKLNAWDYERRLKEILSKFDINDLDKEISKLSGGQVKRLALALVLLDNPDLLILDEPTNHLDIEMIEWLEKYLSQSNITLLMVTHDRYFLDRICNRILEISDGKMYVHKGNYSYFLEKRAEREEVFKTEISKAGKLMKSELEWMRRMPKARTTKSKSRIDAFYKTEEKAKSGKVQDELQLDVKMTRIGGKILELKKVYKSYGDKVILKGFDYTFKKGEKIGIIGKNGVGKSTFLNIITALEQADSGKVNTGDTIIYGYYSQKGINLKEDKRMIDVLKDYAEVITLADGSKLSASQFLNYFLFPPEMQYTPVSKLSGGEKRRLYLLTVLIKNPNFLILDEPTNDLDLITLNKLEEFLENYHGCVIIVSHDRYFMDKIADHLFIFEGNGVIKDFNGKYTEYKWHKEDEEEAQKIAVSNAVKENNKNTQSQQKLSFNEKREFDKLDKDIEKLEKEKAELEKKLLDESDFKTLQDISEKIGKIINEIDVKTLRWLELSERN